jgi:broad specificity phosphatase PhoE
MEGVSKEVYRAWARERSLSTPLPGGESRIQVAARLCTALEAILARPERCALVVTHEILIADLMHAISRQSPAQPHAGIPYAAPYRLSAKDISRAIAFLRNWLSTQPS